MSLFVVDWEADGPVPGLYSGVCFGMVKVDKALKTTFYGETSPISINWKPDALAVSGFTREEHLKFTNPAQTMQECDEWIKANTKGQATVISDNLVFDGMFSAYYFWNFCGHNPFGWSGRRIGDLFCGAEKDFYYKWKWMRKTKHDHNPVNDAIGNAEALLEGEIRYGWKLPK